MVARFLSRSALVLSLANLLAPGAAHAQGHVTPNVATCGTIDNPCPGAAIQNWSFTPVMQPAEAGPFTYTVTVINASNVTGTISVTCVALAAQLPCITPSPSQFTIPSGATRVVTVGYTTKGLGNFQQQIKANWISPNDKVRSGDARTFGLVTVTGVPIGTQVKPVTRGQYQPGDTIRIDFSHPSGVTSSSFKLYVDGNDSTANAKTTRTATSIYAVNLQIAGGSHAYAGYGCAVNGRCDSIPKDSFASVSAPTVFHLDDSLPPLDSELLDPYVGGALPLPSVNLRGCPDTVDDPEINLTLPVSFIPQSSSDPAKNGLIFLASIIWDTDDSVYLYASYHDYKASDHTTCANYTYLTDLQFDWSYWLGVQRNDTLWTYYPYGDRSPGAGAPMRMLRQQVPVAAAPTSAASPLGGSAGRVIPRTPVAGAINPSTYRVTLNGTVIINGGVPIAGVVQQYNTLGGSSYSMGSTNSLVNHYDAANPAASPNGGWNELVASIADSTGHTSFVRSRFVALKHQTGPVAATGLTALRNFSHLSQGDCAAFGTFQCDGVLLTQTVPGFTTRDRDRSLHLVYRSSAQRAPTPLAYQVLVQRLQQPPDSLWVWLREGGVALPDTFRFVGAHVPVGAPSSDSITVLKAHVTARRVIGAQLRAPTAVRDTIRTVTLNVHAIYASGVRDDILQQEVVQLYLNDTTQGRFGPGWALAEQSRLVLGNTSQTAPAAIWLDGDGSYEIFRKVGSAWVSPPGEAARLTENTQTNPDSAHYVLFLESGATVGFRPDGWQAWTADLLGNRTKYAYAPNSSRLVSITDPAGPWYEFLYGAGARDTAILAHPSTGTAIRVASFGYDAQGRLDSARVWRSATKADVTRYGYDGTSGFTQFGAVLDSVIDPRSTTPTPIISTFQYDPLYALPIMGRRPPDRYGVDSVQFRSPWRRAVPRQGYGRAGNIAERLLGTTQVEGTMVDWINLATDFKVDAFGGPTYVRLISPGCPGGFLPPPSCSDAIRAIARDTIGRVLRIARAPDWPSDADSVVYHYDGAGQVDTLIRSTLAYPATTFSLDTTTFTYDTSTTLSTGGMCRRLRTMRDPMGGVTQVNYGASALAQCLPTQTVGLALDTTIFTYGSLNKGDAATVRPISVRDPNGIVQNMQYDASTWNSAVSTRAADGAIDRLYYDGFGRPDSLVDPMGVRTFFRHDQSGRVVHTKTGTGLTTPVAWTFFNPSGLVDSVRVYGSGDNFSIGQDSLPQTAIQTTVNFFDRLGFVDSTRTPAGRWQRFLRDRLGNPIWEYPGNGTYLTRGYDWQGRLIAEYLSPILVGSAFADATTNSVYSGLGVAQGYSLSNGQLHQYGYDAKGRMFSMNDSVVMHTRSFNPAGALVSDILTFADGPVVTRTFQFNRRGQRTLAASAITGVTLSTGESKDSTFYSYNAATARIDSMYERVLTPGGVQAIGRVRWSFDAGGRETLRRALVGTGPGELYIRTAYDAPGRVSLTQDSSTAGIWYRFGSPGYNLADELRTTANGIEPAASGGPANAIQGVSYGFDYDDLATRRLLHSGRSATGGSTKTYDWIYDLFGNRLREIRSGVGCVGPDTSLFSGDNVLRQTLSAPCNRNSHYWTDFAGNRLVQVDTGGATGPQQVLSYTAKNQLFFSLTPTSSLGTYDYNWHWYDGSGLRVITQVWSQAQNGWNALIAPTATTGIRNYYVYDGSDVALTLVKSGGSWWVRSRYLSGGLDDPIAGRFSETASSTQQNLGLVNDRQGTTLAAMKPDGTQEIRVWWFSKNPFGMSDQFTGSGNQINTETGFGGASAPNTNGGFVYLRNRWYDPSTGRFLTQDPIGLAGGVNLYSYAGNNPVGFTDPFGLCPEELRKKADQGECYQWNQQQKNEAIEIINDERAGGNKNALSVPDPSKVVGVNGVAIPGICQKRDSHSNTGCTDGNLIYVNADRDPAAISQTLVHERQHDTGTTQAARSEPCARLRAVFYVRGMSNSHFSSATSGNLPAYTETAPVSRGSCGF